MRSVEIPLPGGLVALVDESDAPIVADHRWRALTVPNKGKVYAIAHGFGATIYMHRLIVSPPKGMHVDHIDHNGLNNTRANLRSATTSQNVFNRRRERSSARNKHGYRGVVFVVNRGLYYGRIMAGGVQYYTPSFATPIEAAAAWDDLAIIHYGEFASLNFPELHAEIGE